MAQTLFLPDGQTFAVTPVFGGVGFRSLQLNAAPHPYPVGWTAALATAGAARPFARPSRRRDALFLSSVSMPSDAAGRPAPSPSRQLAMLLWVSLYWYFHQPEPPAADDAADVPAPARHTPPAARPRRDWRVAIRPDGVLRGRNLLPKLERMGLVAVDDSAAAAAAAAADDDPWARAFVSQPMFWQIPGRLFLFSPQPAAVADRPSSPPPAASAPASPGPGPGPGFPPGPFFSSSHLPTYYPPAPLQYVCSAHDGFVVRHPLRPKPPRIGEVFYSRFVPSAGQYLAFRVASSSPDPVPYLGPVGPNPPPAPPAARSDQALLRAWHALPRVGRFWGPFQPDALDRALRCPHSFPVIGLWDGVPFGYFELYWVKEDILGRHVGSEIADWDRGIHVMIGEDWARGRVPAWLTSLVHWCLTADMRTMNVCLEPRVDNDRILRHLDALGFAKERQVSFPHKRAWWVRLRREAWEGPAL